MINREREQEIISIIKTTGGFVSVKSLCETLFASESSIRRDLKSLEMRGLIKRSYGGAIPASNFSKIVTFNLRARENAQAKREIAKKAAALIHDGQIVFLDQSSTSFYLAGELINRGMLTVITNNIEIMTLLSNSSVKIVSSGGCLSDENRNCLVGGDAVKTFENVFADIMFFSVKGVTQSGDVTDCSREEVLVRNAMMNNAGNRVLLCDSSKFGVRANYRQCSLTDVDCLISEGENARAFSAFEKKIRLL